MKVKPVDVVLVLGSESDRDTVTGSRVKEVFDAMEVSYRFTVASAHRNPKWLERYLEACWRADTRHFVGIAGMSAVLSGDIASHLPMAIVYGVPVEGRTERLTQAAISAILDLPPGTTVRVCGVGSIGLTQVAIAIAKDLANEFPVTTYFDLIKFLEKESAKKPPIPDFDPWAAKPDPQP